MKKFSELIELSFLMFIKITVLESGVHTYSIHSVRKSSGFLACQKTKKPNSNLESSFFRAGYGTRTRDLLITNQLLYQLS